MPTTTKNRLSKRKSSKRRNGKNGQPPVHEIVAFPVKIAIWKRVRENDEGDEFTVYSTKVTRSYMTDDGWANTETIGDDQLLAVSQLYVQAWDWVQQDRQEDYAATKADDND